MVSPRAYSSLLAPIDGPSTQVILAEPGGSVLSRLGGRVSVAEDAERLVDLVLDRANTDEAVWLVGHSRGGGVAWLAARELEAAGSAPAGVVLLDPVWGDGGPRATPPPLPTPPRCPLLIMGFGIGGRCAPSGRNHEIFAAAAPDATKMIIANCGHGDILDEERARPARVLCGGGSDRAASRAAITNAMIDFMNVIDGN